MNERTVVWLGALAGALVGSAAAYLIFTERGRQLREELEPRIRDLANEMAKARDVAADARSAFDDVGFSSGKRR